MKNFSPRTAHLSRAAHSSLRSSYFTGRRPFTLPRSGFTARSAFILLCCLLGTTGLFAQTYSSVNIRYITANYAASPPTVTFEVSWPAGSRNADERSKIWLLVDYQRIQNNAYTGGWLRAGIPTTASAITATAGAVSVEPNNTKGFWL